MSPARVELIHVCADDVWSTPSWLAEGGLEPPLVELLDDPIMTMLWASDGLDPATGRATIAELQGLVRNRDRRPRRDRRREATPAESLVYAA